MSTDSYGYAVWPVCERCGHENKEPVELEDPIYCGGCSGCGICGCCPCGKPDCPWCGPHEDESDGPTV